MTDHIPSKPKLLELFDNAAAFAQFEEYFVKNYPGPRTIISNPRWHAPKIWRAALYALGMNERPAPETNERPATVLKAFDVIREKMRDDPEYAWSWHCNIAMPIMDTAKVSHEVANKAAAHLMQHLFAIDIRDNEHWQWREKRAALKANASLPHLDTCNLKYGGSRCTCGLSENASGCPTHGMEHFFEGMCIECGVVPAQGKRISSMRVLVCGGRDYNGDAEWNHVMHVLGEIHRSTPLSALIQGGASGADMLGRCFADMYGIKCITVPADWNKHGKAAGPIRNGRMLTDFKPNLVVAFPGGRGTADMVAQAEKAGVPVRDAQQHNPQLSEK